MRTLNRFLLFFALIAAVPAFGAIDDSVGIFFPKSLKYLQYSQTEFPVFWWNFAVIEPKGGAPEYATAEQVCAFLQKHEGKEIKRLVCGDNLGGFVETLGEWADDLVLREKYEPSVVGAVEGALGEMSFLGSGQKEIFDLKRRDPLDQWQIYLGKMQMFSSELTRENGFLFDPVTKRLVIPVQFQVAPKMKNVSELMEGLEAFRGVSLVGAHGSSYANERQVHEDLEIVSIVGVLVLVCFIVFLVLKGRLAALLLFPPVAVAMGIATWLTEMIFGSIHGLTLAFGSGIIGLAVDYGLHGAFNATSHQTWKSNAIGFFTTLVALGILVFSGIPLIRQMMVFGALGLILGFSFFYLLCRYLPRYFTIKSIDLRFPAFPFSGVIVGLLIVLGLFSAFEVNLSFDLRKFNYQSPGSAEATNWFFSQGVPQERFLLLRDQDGILEKTAEEARWAKESQIQYVGIGDYLPPRERQLENLSSWTSEGCPSLKSSLSMTSKRVFAPFLTNVCETEHRPLEFADLKEKEYLNQFIGTEKAISLFITKTPDQENSVREKYPEANSLSASIRGFSNSLEEDLRWMIPMALLLCTAILFLYYRKPLFVFSSYIPFLTGLGLFFVVNYLSGRGLDLISVLGLLMVFGFSLDYGIFSTDIYAFPQGGEDESVVYSALALAAFSNIIGFFPMVFAKHPVLNQLGVALFYGTIGTFVGTMWGVKVLLGKRKVS
ncbi:MAG TPA: hypothetical protein PL182_02350 [Pseudobdellovibrionaceae bacterium]|nr:hypothetical protein [Pseudobdellovibrionaceae bacterium]